ncbi:unnamed protein product [Arctogadus glacialis]
MYQGGEIALSCNDGVLAAARLVSMVPVFESEAGRPYAGVPNVAVPSRWRKRSERLPPRCSDLTPQSRSASSPDLHVGLTASPRLCSR